MSQFLLKPSFCLSIATLTDNLQLFNAQFTMKAMYAGLRRLTFRRHISAGTPNDDCNGTRFRSTLSRPTEYFLFRMRPPASVGMHHWSHKERIISQCKRRKFMHTSYIVVLRYGYVTTIATESADYTTAT